MDPSNYIERLIQINRLDVSINNDKIKVQEQVLKKYKNLDTIHKIMDHQIKYPKHNARHTEESQDPNESRYRIARSQSCTFHITPSGNTTTMTQSCASITASTVSLSMVNGPQSQAKATTKQHESQYPSNPSKSTINSKRMPKPFKLPSTPTYEEIIEGNKPEKPLKLQKKEPKYYPKNKAPRAVGLPFGSRGDGYKSPFITVPGVTKNRMMQALVKGKDIPLLPDWLVKLPESHIHCIREIQHRLKHITNTKDPADQLNHITNIIRKRMKLNVISSHEICDILKKIPESPEENGLSFQHFMFAMGSPSLAKKKRIFNAYPRKFSCMLENPEDDQETMKDLDLPREGIEKPKNESSKNQQRHRKPKKCIKKSGKGKPQRITFKPETRESDKYLGKSAGRKEKELKEQLEQQHILEEEAAKQAIQAKGVAILRQQIFFSGLLMIQMYETIEKVNKLVKADYIPETTNVFGYKDFHRMLNDKSGIKRRKMAAWDQNVSHPSDQISPYLASRAICIPRHELVLPNDLEKEVKKSEFAVKFMHYIAQPSLPDEEEAEDGGSIRVTENHHRIHKALRHLAANGDCLAMLPDLDLLLHFADSNVKKKGQVHSSEVTRKDKNSFIPIHSKPKTKVELSHDVAWIINESDSLHNMLVYQLPHELKNEKGLVPLRHYQKLCNKVKQLQEIHWKGFRKEQIEFRSELFRKLDVLSLPTGASRNNFVYSFLALIPRLTKFITHPDLNKSPWRT